MYHLSLHSLVLEQIFGFYLLIMAIIYATRAPFYRRWINNLSPDSTWIIPVASFSLLIGLALVVVSNLWVWRLELVITLIAWLTVVKSILWLCIPEKMISLTKTMYAGVGIYVVAFIVAMVGVLLLAHGFYHFL